MTILTRWTGSTDPADKSGLATFTHGERLLQLKLASFEDARALDEMMDKVMLQARRDSRKAIADWLRGAADQMGVA